MKYERYNQQRIECSGTSFPVHVRVASETSDDKLVFNQCVWARLTDDRDRPLPEPSSTSSKLLRRLGDRSHTYRRTVFEYLTCPPHYPAWPQQRRGRLSRQSNTSCMPFNRHSSEPHKSHNKHHKTGRTPSAAPLPTMQHQKHQRQE